MKLRGGEKVNGKNKSDVKIGAKVKVVLKANQRTGKLTEGTVEKLLTKSSFHPHGIKVMLIDGQVGRVQEFI
nr:YwbE family protein [Sedimentibacter acidaminivorans]